MNKNSKLYNSNMRWINHRIQPRLWKREKKKKDMISDRENVSSTKVKGLIQTMTGWEGGGS